MVSSTMWHKTNGKHWVIVLKEERLKPTRKKRRRRRMHRIVPWAHMYNACNAMSWHEYIKLTANALISH